MKHGPVRPFICWVLSKKKGSLEGDSMGTNYGKTLCSILKGIRLRMGSFYI